jgi:DNA-binding transcriptional ArsR family regulator
MLCVPFTAEDLLRTKFAAEPAPLLELALALAVLQRRDTLFERWRRRVRAALPQAAAPMLELVPPSAKCPHFLHPISVGVEDGLDTVLSTPQALVDRELTRMFAAGRASAFARSLRSRDREAWTELTGAVRSAHQALLGDQWPQVQAGYQAEVGLRARIFAGKGVRAVLTSLYPGSAWDGSALQIPVESQLKIDLADRGVTLMPSVLWRDRPLFSRHPDGSLLMIYSAATPLPLLTNEAGDGSLAALLGTTRAAILALAAAAPTTTEVAHRAGVSASSASEHAKVLRQCGLITTTRDGKAVRHGLTRLGDQLLTGRAEDSSRARAK